MKAFFVFDQDILDSYKDIYRMLIIPLRDWARRGAK